jgi:hypothetical protein
MRARGWARINPKRPGCNRIELLRDGCRVRDPHRRVIRGTLPPLSLTALGAETSLGNWFHQGLALDFELRSKPAE